VQKMLIVAEEELSRPQLRHCHGNRQSEKGRARSSMWNMSIVKLNKFVCFSHSALLPEMRVCACMRASVCFVVHSVKWAAVMVYTEAGSDN